MYTNEFIADKSALRESPIQGTKKDVIHATQIYFQMQERYFHRIARLRRDIKKYGRSGEQHSWVTISTLAQFEEILATEKSATFWLGNYKNHVENAIFALIENERITPTNPLHQHSNTTQLNHP